MRFALGTCDYWDKHDEMYKELGIRWIKQPAGYPADPDHVLECIQAPVKAGLEVILDLRTETEFLFPGIISVCPSCGARYRVAEQDRPCRTMVAPGQPCDQTIKGMPLEEAERLLTGQDIAYVTWVYKVMEKVREVCHTIEVWGEPQCPLLTASALPPKRLTAWMANIRRVKFPETVLMNGGLGIGPWKDVELMQLVTAQTLRHADMLNLHPFSFQGDPDVQVKLYDWMLSSCRHLMQKYDGIRLPIAISEWGYPSGVGAWEGALLASGVMPMPIEAVSENQQAAIMDACFRLFKNYDVGPICLMLRDQQHLNADGSPAPQANFWGFHCGVLRFDESRKQSYDVLYKWGHIEEKKSKPKRKRRF